MLKKTKLRDTAGAYARTPFAPAIALKGALILAQTQRTTVVQFTW